MYHRRACGNTVGPSYGGILLSPQHERMLRHFEYSHLPPVLQQISGPLCELARDMVIACENSEDSAEVTVGLRKLLEAKDCFVRSMVKH